MEDKKKHLSLPSNYVTLADLQQRWLQQQQQQQQPPPPPVEPQQPHQHQHEKKELQQNQRDSHQRRATSSRFFPGKQRYNRDPNRRYHNRQKNSGDSESQLVVAGIRDIDGSGDVNIEDKCSKELNEKVKLKSKQVRVVERGTKFEQENKEKEKEERHQEDLHQQRHRGTAIRSFARKQSRFNRRNHLKIHSDSVTYAEKQRNIGGGDANLESKGKGKLEKNEKAKPKPKVYEREIKTEEKKEDEDVKQEQRNGTASRSFSVKHHRNAPSYHRRKVPADLGTNAEKQCGDTGIGEGESTVNATAKPKPQVQERKTEVEEVNGKKQREEVNDAENEKAKIIESQSTEEKSGGGCSKMEEVEQRFRGLGFRRAHDGFSYAQPRRGSYGGRGYGYSNRNGYRRGYGYDYGYGNSDFGGFRAQHYDGSGKRGEKRVWVKKVDNIDGTEN